MSRPLQDLHYYYDRVGNIMHIKNDAPTLPSGLGAAYRAYYKYDDLYRLVYANCDWDNGMAHYALEMAYEADGRIARKIQSAHAPLSNPINMNLKYLYSDPSQPHAVQEIYDQQTGESSSFHWDSSGNLTWGERMNGHHDRRHLWDEENRLAGVADDRMAHYYQYDADGERTLKFSGQHSMMTINGVPYYYFFFDRPTLYASPYVVATPQGYTKHYFVDSERIACNIGNGGLHELFTAINPEEDFNQEGRLDHILLDELSPRIRDKMRRHRIQMELVAHSLGLEAVVDEAPLRYLRNYIHPHQEREVTFFYHPDHLGSGSWISDTAGQGIQFLYYLPWGEEWINQQNSAYATRYTFSGKEYDRETGYNYFGARYYNSTLSTWLSVDPQSDKYPSLTPYAYCNNNPIILKDPNGEFPKRIHAQIVMEAFGSSIPQDVLKRIVRGTSYMADVRNFSNPAVHMDGMTDVAAIVSAYEAAMSKFHKEMSNGNYEEAGIALHTIADFYSHSNYVKLYQEYRSMQENPVKDENDIEPFSVMMYDKEFMNFAIERGLRTGDYSLWRHWSQDENSHNKMNLDKPRTVEGKTIYGYSTRYKAARWAAQMDINKLVNTLEL